MKGSGDPFQHVNTTDQWRRGRWPCRAFVSGGETPGPNPVSPPARSERCFHLMKHGPASRRASAKLERRTFGGRNHLDRAAGASGRLQHPVDRRVVVVGIVV